jgi:hypothetical protein
MGVYGLEHDGFPRTYGKRTAENAATDFIAG